MSRYPLTISSECPSMRRARIPTSPIIWAAVNGVSTFIVVNLMCGMVLAFSAILLPQIEADVSARSFDVVQQSLIASVVSLAQVAGAPLQMLVAKRFGRLISLVACHVAIAIAWAVVALSGGHFAPIIVGRVVQGLFISSAVSQVYVAEITSSRFRQACGAMGSTGISIGVLLVYVIGWLGHWVMVAWLSFGANAALAVYIWFALPESPRWLFHVGLEGDALLALRRLRSRSEVANTELAAWREAAATVDKSGVVTANMSKTSSVAHWKSGGLIRAVLVINFFTLFVMMSGNMVVVAYAVDLATDLGFTTEPYVVAMVFGCVRLSGCVASYFLLRRLAMRPVLICTGVVASIALVTLGLSIKVADGSWTVDAAVVDSVPVARYTSLLSVTLFAFAFMTGIGSIPWFLPSEMIAMRARDAVTGVAVAVAYGSIFLSVFLFNYVQDGVGVGYAFLTLCAPSAVLATVIGFACIPETRDLTEERRADSWAARKCVVDDDMASTTKHDASTYPNVGYVS